MISPSGSGPTSHADSAHPALSVGKDLARRADPAPARRGVATRRSGAGALPSPDRVLWEQMLEHLRKSHPDICRAWFNLIDVLGMASGTLNLRAHSNIHRDYLKRTSAEAFNDAARTVSGRLISVRFLGPDESWTESSAASTWPAPIEPEAPRPAEGEGPSFGSATEPGTDLDPYAPVGGVPLTEPPAGESAIPSSAPEATTPQPAQPLLEATPQDRPALTRESPASRVVIETRERRDDALVINPDYNFENFVVGPGNRLAHAAGLAVGENQGRQYNPLFIHGGVGLGKTHLLQAACLRILDHNPAARVYYVSCEGFMTQFMESVQSGKMAEFRHRYRDVDVLVVDDIHFLAKRNRTQEEFFHTFNTLYQAGKQILLSSDAAPEEIPDLEERLVSRFKWGLVAKIDPPCYETRVAILKTKAKVRGMTLPDDCACFIAARIDTNIRELEGAITRLQILASVEGRPIDLDLARTSLGGLSLESPPEPSIQQIITAVTDYFHIRLSDLQSKKRPRSVTLPRQICMYFARKLTRLSLGEIGGYFGGRDHTTVMHAVKAVETREEVEPDFAPTLRAIEEKIRAAA